MSITHHYDVFLSFRGPDTRQGLTDCLYHFMNDAGVRVFRDDDELSIGQPIETILLAINNSKMCVPVLSPAFASSAWCLREAAKMVELKKEIVPVFVGVTPDDVKLRSSVYRDEMVKHEIKYGKDQVKQWEDALKEIATIKGRELKDKGHWEFSKEITTEVLIKLKTNQKHVPNYLPGVDDHVEIMLKLIDIESGGVRCVGIHGMGGIGKTTLAKVVFNKLSATFDSCCFLPDIRESSRRNGIEYLKKELLCKFDGKLRDMLPYIDPIVMTVEKFCREKVLIVLDDVDKNDHILKLLGETKHLASGSRIIVTTRDAQVLRIGRKSFDEIFEVKELSLGQGLQLFSHKAFGMEFPPHDSESLSEEVVRSCKGLPLALEVMGSLFGQIDKSKWPETVKSLKKSPHPTVLNTLRISYDTLEDKQQQIFLDIACFFINTEKSYVSYMWEACDFSPVLALDVLISLCLIKIVEDDKLWMHDHIRDLGREIVREEGRQKPRSCSRLWEQNEDMMDILKNKDGNSGLVGLRLEGACASPLDEVLAGSQNLRFLSMEEAKFRKKFKCPLPQLKWLSMRQCSSSFSASHLNIRNLVILELPDSSINEKWKGWNCIEMVNLKVLDLTNCIKLRHSPDFSRIPNLERLTLRRCINLVKLHHSVVMLRKLKYMDLNDCSSLGKLPEEIGCLENLEEMYLRGCTKLKSFPSSLGKLKSLVALDLSGKQNSLVKLMSLTNLFLGSTMDENMNVLILREFIGPSIMEQTIFAAKVVKDIAVARRIPSIPVIFSDLKLLTKLDLSYLSVSSLPESFGNLENLVELKARQSCLSALPKSIGMLKKLETLNLAGGIPLLEVGEEIGGLSNLRTLNLSWTSITELPSAITQLSLLESLSLANCDGLGQHQPANALPTSFGSFSQLEILQLYCEHLECIPTFPSSLRRLILDSLNQGVKLPDMSNLKNLTYLSIYFCGGESKVEDLERFPDSLRELRLLNADALPDLSNLKYLRKLLVGGGDLKAITGLAKLESLEELDICSCGSLESLENLSELKNLKYLSVLYCVKLSVVEGHDRLPLVQKDVHLGGCECAQCVTARTPSMRKEFLLWVAYKMGIFDGDGIARVRHYLRSTIMMVMEDQKV